MHKVEFYQQLALVMAAFLAHAPAWVLGVLPAHPVKIGYLLYCVPWGGLLVLGAVFNCKVLRRISAIFVCAAFSFLAVGIYKASGFVPAVGPYAAAAAVSGITGLGIPRG